MILEKSCFGVFLALLFSGAAATAASPDDERVKQLLKEARAFYSTGRYDLSARRCEQILEVDPANKDARLGLLQTKRADAAQKERAKVILPTNPPQYVGPVPRSSEFR